MQIRVVELIQVEKYIEFSSTFFFFLENAEKLRFIILRSLKHVVRAPILSPKCSTFFLVAWKIKHSEIVMLYKYSDSRGD
jgi:hypothetical protein